MYDLIPQATAVLLLSSFVHGIMQIRGTFNLMLTAVLVVLSFSSIFESINDLIIDHNTFFANSVRFISCFFGHSLFALPATSMWLSFYLVHIPWIILVDQYHGFFDLPDTPLDMSQYLMCENTLPEKSSLQMELDKDSIWRPLSSFNFLSFLRALLRTSEEKQLLIRIAHMKDEIATLRKNNIILFKEKEKLKIEVSEATRRMIAHYDLYSQEFDDHVNSLKQLAILQHERDTDCFRLRAISLQKENSELEKEQIKDRHQIRNLFSINSHLTLDKRDLVNELQNSQTSQPNLDAQSSLAVLEEKANHRRTKELLTDTQTTLNQANLQNNRLIAENKSLQQEIDGLKKSSAQQGGGEMDVSNSSNGGQCSTVRGKLLMWTN